MELLKLWKIICRRKWLFIQIVLVIVLVPLIGSFLVKPVYRYKAKVWIKYRDLQPQFLSWANSGFPADLGKLYYSTSDYLPDTFVALIESRQVSENVIKNLNLRDKKGNLYDISSFVEPSYIKKVFTQRTGVEAEQIEDSELFEIKAYSTDHETAVKIANGFAEEFLRLFYNLNRDAATMAKKTLENEVSRVKEDWDKAEEKRTAFRTAKIVVDIDKQKDDLLGELTSLRSKKTDTESKIEEDKGILTATEMALKKHPEFKLSQTSVEYNPLLKTYKSKLFDLELSLAEKLNKWKDAHPELKTIKSEIEFTKKAIKDEIGKTFSSETTARNSYYDTLIQKYGDAEIEIVSSRAKARSINSQIARIENELKDIIEKDLQYSRVSKNADNLKTLYSNLLSQLEVAKISEALSVSNASVIEKAAVALDASKKNYKYFPNKKLILIISIFLGIVTGLCAVLLLDYIDNTFRSTKDIADCLNRPVLVTIPKVLKADIINNG